MKIVLAHTIGIFLFMYNSVSSADNFINQITPSEAITITISPERPIYRSKQYFDAIDDPVIDRSNSSEFIRFIITIKNKSHKPITIVHPWWTGVSNLCANGCKSSDFYGKSEILLKIIKPNGKSITIREHPSVFSFDIDSSKTTAVIKIPSHQERSFIEGRFFHTPMDRWESEAKAWEIFSETGMYKVKIIFRNIYSKATFNKEPSGTYDILNVWTGELQSDEAVVKIL